MTPPFLLQIRTGGEIKSSLKGIIRDVNNRFEVRRSGSRRDVPHATLFGPYDTNQGAQVKQSVQEVLSRYHLVPYRISGFDRFEKKNVIFADVEPSSELRSLRRDLSENLRPITHDQRPWDGNFCYDFHITIAKAESTSEFEKIWEYVTDNYNPDFDTYAKRVTSLRGREMMWEWDVPRSEELRQADATSEHTWEQTLAELDRLKSMDGLDAPSSQYGLRKLLFQNAVVRWTVWHARKLVSSLREAKNY